MGWRKIVYGRDDDTFKTAFKRAFQEGMILGMTKAVEISGKKELIEKNVEKRLKKLRKKKC
jgi:glutamate-1-semialdehyde aminotransferase